MMLTSVVFDTSFRNRDTFDRRPEEATDAVVGQNGEAALSRFNKDGESVENVVPLAPDMDGAR